jgi:hypothetical protein
VEVRILKGTASVREARSIVPSGKCGRALKTEKQNKKSFDFRHIILPIDLMINLILFCFVLK